MFHSSKQINSPQTSSEPLPPRLMACYYAWRGDLVYGIYKRMGGSRSRDEVSELFDQEMDLPEYKAMVGGWMKKLLEDEGRTPGAMVLNCLKHPVGRRPSRG